MEIKISNFGPIKEFKMDLSKDLIFIYGKNNAGKSYAISVVYLLLKHLLDLNSELFNWFAESKVKGDFFDELTSQIREKKEYDITDKVNMVLKNSFTKALAGKPEKSFINTFGHLSRMKNIKSGEPVQIEINILNHIICFTIGDTFQLKDFSLNKDVIVKMEGEKEGKLHYNGQIIIYPGAGTEMLGGLIERCIDDIINKIRHTLGRAFGSIYFLPASKSGLSMGMDVYKPLFAKLSQSDGARGAKFEIPSMPEPHSDFILMQSGIQGIPTRNKLLNNIVKDLEEKILGGTVNFDNENKRLTYSPRKSKLVLDMNSVSSMVSELSPLVALFKFIFHEGTGKDKNSARPIIFIEEPEAHLHPGAQVLLAEILVKLAEKGIKVIITSHGNYIFNKIGNMLLSETLDPSKIDLLVLKETPEGSVSNSMKADDLGVEDENFIDTADALYEERELIIDKRNEETDDR